jgi:prepilin-type N-terminal cleavage/methylation domain-containing protein
VDKKAFTLIELIAVIMIISIIVGIALPRFGGVKDEALITKAKVELRTIQSGLESYYMHQTPNAYPPSSDTVISDYLMSATPQIVSSVLSRGPDGELDITGISDEGEKQGLDDDDIYVTNGEGNEE